MVAKQRVEVVPIKEASKQPHIRYGELIKILEAKQKRREA